MLRSFRSFRSLRLYLGLFGLVSAFALILSTRVAHGAATTAILVNDLSDNAIAADGVCTLREAISNANAVGEATGGDCAAGSGSDTINFSVSGIITLTNSLPPISNTLTIDGSGQSITISGNNFYRPLYVNIGSTVNLSGLIIADGRPPGNNGGGLVNDGTLSVANSIFLNNQGGGGGGILNGGILTVTFSTFSGNSAGGGGGIYNTGTLSIDKSALSGNSARDGGGIFNTSIMAVTNSTFSSNSSIGSPSGTAPLGGGIYNNGILNVINSTFFDNSATSSGGGIYNNNGTLNLADSTLSGNGAHFGGAVYNTGIMTLTNSTLSGNNTIPSGNASYGGGIYNNGVLVVINSTVSGNSATNTASGIYNTNISSMVMLKNTLIANSIHGANCFNNGGILTADSYNLADDNTCGGATVKTSAQINLGPLANNGGPTQTFALLYPSAAIDAGDDDVCATSPVNNLDQRGVSRPQGAHCDVGAYEAFILQFLPVIFQR